MIDKLWLVAKGLAMGAADVVPGVSGGTIALLTGIYPRLINAITGLNIDSIKQLSKGQFKQFWKTIDGQFVLPLLIGIATAFLLLAHPIKYAIANHPILTWSFFFGLIIASALLIIMHMQNKKPKNYIWILPGIIFGLWIGSLTSLPFPNSQSAVLIAGMFAICAMILPGISGSFILVILGMYEQLITAVSDKNWMTLFTFIAGAIIGLLTFSRVIKWVLSRFYQMTLFFLSGLMLGSLIKVWPWKLSNSESMQGHSSAHMLVNTSPFNHPNPQLTNALSMMVFAFILVFIVEYLGKKLTKTK